MRKNNIALIFFVTGVFLSLASSKITGNFISDSFDFKFSYFSYGGIIFILLSYLIFMSRQKLDAIVIPRGGGEWDSKEEMYSQDEERTKKALRRKRRLNEKGYFVVSGLKKEGEETPEGQSKSIERYLTNHGVSSEKIIIEGKSHDTLENVLYTLKKIKEKEIKEHGKTQKPIRVAFVSYPEHLKRFEDFENQAVKDGFFEKGDFEFYKIRTFPEWEKRKEQRRNEKGYEGSPLRKLSHKLKLLTMGRYKLN